MEPSPTQPQSGEKPFAALVAPLIILTTIFYLNFLARITVAPLMPVIEKDLSVGHDEAGLLFLLVTLGYFLTVTTSGFVSARISHRGTIALSALAAGGALFLPALGSGLYILRLGMLLVGLSAGLYLPSGIATITNLAPRRHWGKALAIHELAPNVALASAPVLAELFLANYSWQTMLGVLGAVSMLLGLNYLRFGRGGGFRGQPPTPAAVRTLLSEPSYWVMVALFALGIGGTLGVFSVLPLYLTAERGLERTFANQMLSLSRLAPIAMAFLAGWANDRLGPKRTLRLVFLLSGGAICLLALAGGPWLLTAVFLQPMLAVGFFPPGFAALSAIGPPQVRNIAVSIAIPPAFLLGGGAVPAGLSLAGQAGSFAAGFLAWGAITLGGFGLVHFLRFGRDA